MATYQLQLKRMGDEAPMWTGVLDERESTGVVKEFYKSQRDGSGASFPAMGGEVVFGADIMKVSVLTCIPIPEAPKPQEDPRVQEMQYEIDRLHREIADMENGELDSEDTPA